MSTTNNPPQLVDRLVTDLRRAMEFVRNPGDALAALAESVERVRVDDDDDAATTSSPPPLPDLVENHGPLSAFPEREQEEGDPNRVLEDRVLRYPLSAFFQSPEPEDVVEEEAEPSQTASAGSDRMRDLELIAGHASVVGLGLPPDLVELAYEENNGELVNTLMDLTEPVIRRRLEQQLAERQEAQEEEVEEEELEGEDDESVDSWDTNEDEEEEEEVVDENNLAPPLAPGLAQLIRAVQDARADYESASTNRFNAGEFMIELDNEYERLVARNERRREQQQRLVAQARRRWESATREEQYAAQRRRDLELLLAQRRYAEPMEAVVLYNRSNPETLRQSIRTLVDQTLEAHLTRQRAEGRPAPLPLMWQEAVRQVQNWFPDQPRAMVATSLQWNRLREGVQQAHEEEPSVVYRGELPMEATWQRAAREFMEEFGGSYAYGDREATEDLAGAQTAEVRTQTWHTYIAERKQRLIVEMETLEARMEAEEINENEYLEGMNRLGRRYNAIGRRWRTLGA